MIAKYTAHLGSLRKVDQYFWNWIEWKDYISADQRKCIYVTGKINLIHSKLNSQTVTKELSIARTNCLSNLVDELEMHFISEKTHSFQLVLASPTESLWTNMTASIIKYQVKQNLHLPVTIKMRNNTMRDA